MSTPPPETTPFSPARGPSLLAALCGLAAALAAAAPTPAAVKLNEILLFPGYTGAELLPYKAQWVELYNPGPGTANLAGWTLADRDGTALAVLPAVTLPAQAYLTIHWDTGTDDFDFSDADGHYYLNNTSLPFDRRSDECALYSAAPSVAAIVDFVAWNIGPAYVPGTAHGHAVAAGLWTSGAFVDPGYIAIANTLGRTFNGWDTNTPGDWMIYRWFDYITPGYTQPANPVQLAPEKNLVLTDTTPLFDWQDSPVVDFYQLQVDDQHDFSSPVIDVDTPVSEYQPAAPLDGGAYFYRVRGSQGGVYTDWSAAWLFAVDDTGTIAALDDPRTACPFRWQHKDTRLLCIWENEWSERPGCAELGAHAWDIPHPDGPPPDDEPHCANYCARASIAMINARYGGNLSQDRISYHYFKEIADRVAGPEGDLGHGSWLVGQDFINTISWALGGAAITAHPAPAGGFTFQQLRDWFDTHGCFVTNLPGHVVVTNGYTNINFSLGNIVIRVIKINDPARGPNRPKIYTWQVGGLPQPGGITDDITWVFLQPAPPAVIAGRQQEAAVTTDSDGDGVMDFDEGTPRAFHSNKNLRDTDRDQVEDKNEIRNYTFHDTYHAGHDNDALNFPDIDGDGFRAENDCDADSPRGVGGDGDFDGGEDIDGDGHNPGAGETCLFDPAEFLITVSVNKDIYQVPELVYLVDWHGSRETHTYHANSLYWYELGQGCPSKPDGSALGHSGAFTTNVGGHANPALVMLCRRPGLYYLTVDVLTDNKYSTPDNTDPQTCWLCIRRCWDYPFPRYPVPVTYGPSTYTLAGLPVGTTFPGGVTPPPYTFVSDSIDLDVDHDGWRWPADFLWNGNPLHWDVVVEPLDPEHALRVELVASSVLPGSAFTLEVNEIANTYRILDENLVPLYQGVWSLYPGDMPLSLGFEPTGIVRQNFQPCLTCLGDMDHSGVVHFDDLPPFVDNLLAFRPDYCADVNDDLRVDGLDIQPMVDLILANGGAGTPCEQQAVTVPPGIDCFSTVCDGTSFFDFGPYPIGPNFFDPGSDPFLPPPIPWGGLMAPFETDTLVHRTGAMTFPPELPATAAVPIEIVQLNLVSCQPITVTYFGGAWSQQWNVEFSLSEVAAPQGILNATKLDPAGGVFDATLPVQPRLLFTQVDNPSNIRVLDTGLAGYPPMQLHASNVPWLHAEPFGSACAPQFAPGFQDVPPEGPCGVPACLQSLGPGLHRLCGRPPNAPPCP